jgi:hypothetical protein
VALRAFPPAETERLWRELLGRVPMPSHYTSPEFFREPYFDDRAPFAVLAVVEDQARGVVTGFRDGDAINCGLPTRPQIQLQQDEFLPVTIATLCKGLKSVFTDASLISIYAWDTTLDPFTHHGYRRKQISSIPVMDLTLGAEALMKKCDRTRKQAVRSAQKNGVSITEATTEAEYFAFHEIYEQWSRAKKLESTSWDVEQRAFRDTRANRKLFLARHDGKIIAGSSFRFIPNGVVEYSRNSSQPEAQTLKANDALLWHGIEWAIGAGFREMSMGASHRFLRSWGGDPRPVYRYRLDKTLLRRHDRKEDLLEWGAKTIAGLPPPWEEKIRKVLKKEKKAGW